MPSSTHEALVEIFRHHPALVAELLTETFGLDLPDHQQVRVEPAELNDLVPTEYRADAVVVLHASDTPVWAVVVEVQLTPDKTKRWSWPAYCANLRARLRCPVVLPVICVKESMAASCATPIDLGHPGCVLVPLVLGPDRIPLVTDVDQASRAPEMALLSAIVHSTHPRWGEVSVLDAVVAGLASIDPERLARYNEIQRVALPAAKNHSEAQPPRCDGAARSHPA